MADRNEHFQDGALGIGRTRTGTEVYVQTSGTLHTDRDCSLAGRRSQSRPSAMTYTDETAQQVAEGINRWCRKCG